LTIPDFKFKTKFGKNLTKRYRLVPHLDEYFRKEVTGLNFTLTEKEPDDAWHPSGDCVPAATALYDSAIDRIEGRVEKTFMKAFPVGHFWHALCQKAVLDLGFATPEAIEREGKRVWDEKPFHWARGAADVAPLCLPNSDPLVVDFKTMGGRDYGNDNTPMPAWAANKYEAQLNIYMDFFDYNEGIIVAIQKDSPHGMKEFEYRRNQPLIDAIYEKWEFVSECFCDRIPPSSLDDVYFSLDELFKGPVEL
jgi:hypothetical protein